MTPRFTAFLLLILFGVSRGRAGTIVGLVQAVGPAEAKTDSGSDGLYQSRRYKFAEKIDFDHLQDFVVYIDQAVENAPATSTSAEVKMERNTKVAQHNANFEPHVLPIAVGTTVRWPNDDDIYHNVFSISDAKAFDLQLYKKERVPEIIFDKVGKVDVFCNIHSNMHCIILVLPSPYFTKLDANKRYVIKNVPAGRYKLTAWHERLPGKSVIVDVPADGEIAANFILGLAELPKY